MGNKCLDRSMAVLLHAFLGNYYRQTNQQTNQRKDMRRYRGVILQIAVLYPLLVGLSVSHYFPKVTLPEY